jgi:hypothetical protein
MRMRPGHQRHQMVLDAEEDEDRACTDVGASRIRPVGLQAKSNGHTVKRTERREAHEKT